jgi:hypothetical protein
VGREDAEHAGLVSSDLEHEVWRRWLDGPEPDGDDRVYQRWLRATVKQLLGRAGASHAIASDDERQWAERAVMESALAWAPGRYEVVLGTASAAALGRDRTPYETWLQSVHAVTARETYVITGEQERAWAERAIADRQLEWELDGLSLRRPRSGDGDVGPYR